MVVETKQDSVKQNNISLLQKLDIPVTHLDFSYVEKCTDSREIEKILRILQSGEEGYYPDFQDFVQKRLEKLNPQSHQLRVETPVLRSTSLEKDVRLEIENDLSTWLGQYDKSQKDGDKKIIFKGSDISGDVNRDEHRPIRGTVGVTTNVEIKQNDILTESGSGDNFLKPKNPNRIKSWDYEKWDKFNADAELTKLEIEEMRVEELKNQQKTQSLQKLEVNMASTSIPKSKPAVSSTLQEKETLASPKNPVISQTTRNQEQIEIKKTIPKNINNSNIGHGQLKFEQKYSTNNTKSIDKLGPSFIEEISEESEISNLYNTNTMKVIEKQLCPSKPQLVQQEISNKSEKEKTSKKKEGKRFKIIIDDLRIA